MNTTNLFVELVVIGIGVFVWLLMIFVAGFGYGWYPIDNAILFGTALPALAFIYVFGIIWDRIADWVFDAMWSHKIHDRHFSSKGEYYNARRLILTKSESLSELLEYGRSRLRICRGWALNALMMSVCWNVMIWSRFTNYQHSIKLSIFGTMLFVLIAISACLAWRSLSIAEYRKIKQQAQYLDKIDTS